MEQGDICWVCALVLSQLERPLESGHTPGKSYLGLQRYQVSPWLFGFQPLLFLLLLFSDYYYHCCVHYVPATVLDSFKPVILFIDVLFISCRNLMMWGLLFPSYGKEHWVREVKWLAHITHQEVVGRYVLKSAWFEILCSYHCPVLPPLCQKKFS